MLKLWHLAIIIALLVIAAVIIFGQPRPVYVPVQQYNDDIFVNSLVTVKTGVPRVIMEVPYHNQGELTIISPEVDCDDPLEPIAAPFSVPADKTTIAQFDIILNNAPAGSYYCFMQLGPHEESFHIVVR